MIRFILLNLGIGLVNRVISLSVHSTIGKIDREGNVISEEESNIKIKESKDKIKVIEEELGTNYFLTFVEKVLKSEILKFLVASFPIFNVYLLYTEMLSLFRYATRKNIASK